MYFSVPHVCGAQKNSVTIHNGHSYVLTLEAEGVDAVIEEGVGRFGR